MQLKHAVVSLAVAGMLSVQAYASESQVEAATQSAQPVAAFTESDLASLFDNADQPMQLAALTEQEMRETEGAFAFLPFLAYSLGSAALSSWIYHGRSYYNTGRLGSSSGAAWAAASGLLGGVHGRGLAAGAGLVGWQSRVLSGHGMAVSGAWNMANPFRGW